MAFTWLTGFTVDGNVGIGTTASPSQKLEVSGNIKLTSAADVIYFGAGGTSATWSAPQVARIGTMMTMSDYSGVQFGGYDGTSYGPRMTVLGTGNVGIGTTSPDVLLTLSEVTNNTSLGFYNTGTNSANRNWVIGSNDQVFGDFAIMTSTAIGGNPISAGVKRLYINPIGNVGIGTTSPGYKLDVTGDARFGDGNNFNPLIQYAGSGRVAASPGYSFVGDLDTGMFNPNLGNTLAFTTAGSERMRIDSAGNVNINTGYLRIIGGADQGSQLSLWADSGGDTHIAGYQIGFNTGLNNVRTEKMRIDSAGAIQFNSYNSTNQTGTPTYLLGTDASGNIVKTNTVPGSAAGPYLPLAGTSVSGNITGTVVSTSSIQANSFYDGHITWVAAQLNRYGAAIELQYVPTNSSTTIRIGAGGSNPTTFNAYTGEAIFTGDVTIPEFIYHAGNTTTKFGFGGNNNYSINLNGDNVLDFYQTVLYLKKPTEFLGLNVTLSGQASPQIFMTSNTAGTPNWTMIARTDGYFLLGRSGVSNDFYFDPSGNATFSGDVAVLGGDITISKAVDDVKLNIFNTTTNGKNWYLDSYSNGNLYFGNQGGNFLNLNGTSGNATFAGTVTSPTFLGDLNGTINTVTTAVTKANSTNDTTVATTAFVQNLIGTIPAGLVFQGTWNAATNTPTLTSGTGTTGNFYIVSTSGSTNLDGVTDWVTGDWAVFIEQGATDAWEKIDNSSVLDGAGTGQTVALWSGSGTSNTLTDSIITQTGSSPSHQIRITSEIDAQLRLDGGTTSYAGIHWVDVSGNDYMWFNGSSGTFAIGGGGSGISGKKLHIDGSTSIGSNYDAASPPTNGLVVEGNVGIGTTSPQAPLQVNADIYSIIRLGADYNYSENREWQFRTNTFGSGSWGGIALQQSTAQQGNTFTTKFGVDINGNVGIGTTSPGAKLEVSADVAKGILINRTYTTSSQTLSNVRAYYGLAITPLRGGAGGLYFTNYDADTPIIQSVNSSDVAQSLLLNPLGGNVGIGTTSPGAKLDVKDGSSAMRFQEYSNGASLFLDGVDGDFIGGDYFNISAYGATELAFGYGAATKMVMKSTGNVGIGTTSPGEPLTVKTKTAAYFPGIKVEDYDSSMGLYVQNIEGSNSGIGTGRYHNSGYWRSDVTVPTTIRLDGGAIRFYAQSGVTADVDYVPIERMNIAATGSIKFNSYDSTNNTGTPTYLLGTDASGNIVKTNTIPGSAAGPYLPVANPTFTGTLTGPTAVINSTTSNDYRSNSDWYGTSSGFWDFRSMSGGASKMRISSAGNVSIGNTTDVYKLDVTGTGRFTLGVTFNSQVSLASSGARLLLGLDTGYGLIQRGQSSTGTSALLYFGETLDTGATIFRGSGLTSFESAIKFSNYGAGTLVTDASGNITVSSGGGAGGPYLPLAGGALSGTGRVLTVTSTNDQVVASIKCSASGVPSTLGFQGDGSTSDYHVRVGANTTNFVAYTNNIERMRITSTGNVGIGTTAPKQKLIVEGTLATKPNGVDGYYSYLRSNWAENDALELGISEDGLTNFHKLITSSNYHFGSILQFWTSDTERMRITAAGNVGIGTTSPLNKLDVSGGVGDGANYDSIISLSRTSSTSNVEVAKIVLDDFDTNHANLVFRVKTTASSAESPGYYTDALTIKGTNGNVGIGTTSPNTSLTVNVPFSSNGQEEALVSGQTSTTTLSGLYSVAEDVVAGKGALSLKTYNAGSYGERMRITAAGNVGIGTTSPRTKTEFASGLPTSIPTYSNTTNGIVVTDGGDIYGRIGVSNFSASSAGYPTYIQAGDWSGATYYNLLLNPNGGNVGIGTTGPTHKLDVSGTGRFTSTVTATNFILSSDERKKTKIKDLSRDNIDISWKSFEMKSDEGEYRVGVIAQELEIKHPEFVNTDNEGFKSVKYIDLLISKIAELEARLEKAGI